MTPGHVLADVPSQFPTAEPGVLYSPRNYDGQFRGPLLARAALAGSENVPAVALASEIGVPTIARLLRRAGLTTLDKNAAHYGLGLTLGNAEVRLDELVAAYAMFARGGDSLHADASIRSIDGTRAPCDRPPSACVVRRAPRSGSPTSSRTPTRARTSSAAAAASSFRFRSRRRPARRSAYLDNWAIGYTRDVTVGVWVGNFDRTPLRGSSGVTGAGPIFHAVMLAAVEHARGTLPIGDHDADCARRRRRASRRDSARHPAWSPTDACPTRVSEWLPTGAPLESCTWHHASDEGLVTVWPAGLRDWARTNGLLRDRDEDAAIDGIRRRRWLHGQPAPLVVNRRAGGPQAEAALAIAAPLAGAVFLIDPTLRAGISDTRASSARGGAAGMLEWSVDGSPVGRADRDDGASLAACRAAGTRSPCATSAGRSAHTAIDVR